MKQAILLFTLLTVGITAFSQAQEARRRRPSYVPDSRTQIFFRPLPLIIGGFEAGAEFQLTEYHSMRINGGYYLQDNAWYYRDQFSDDQGDMEGFRAEIQGRKYFEKPKENFNSLYVGLYGLYKQIDIAYSSVNTFTNQTLERDIASNAYGFGGLIGYQLIVKPGIIIDFNVGGGINYSAGGEAAEAAHIVIVNPYLRGMAVRSNLTFGFKL